MKRCNWKNLENSDIYINYHDNEWGVESHDERYLFEMLVLESFHCGLSWLIILKKRDNFKKAFDNFDVLKVANYTDEKIAELMLNDGIIRHKGKVNSAISNAKAFIKIQNEFGSFDKYIWSFTGGNVVYSKTDEPVASNELSDKVSKDLKKRGFKFMGTVTTYSYLEAIGVMNNHVSDCFRYSGVTLRKYESSDIKEIAELFYNTVHSVNAKDYSKDELNAWATGTIDTAKWDESFKNHYSLVAEFDGQIVGFGDIDGDYLDRLYVHKDYQNMGIGTKITNDLENYAVNKGVKSITTHASITAKTFFESRGYKTMKSQQVERQGVFLTNFVMIKTAN